jgi:histidine phosphotransferase ChpT
MTRLIDLRVLELLTARLCHDLIGPVAAIANGVELLGEDDPDFVRDAVALVGDSARKAVRRLQFYRFAYGFRPGGMVAAAPHILVGELLEETEIACDYPQPVRALPLEWQKLVCNLVAIAAETMPRGGRMMLAAQNGGITLEGAGGGSGFSAEVCDALALTAPVEALTPRTVAAYFSGLLGQALGCRVTATSEPGRFRVVAAP